MNRILLFIVIGGLLVLMGACATHPQSSSSFEDYSILDLQDDTLLYGIGMSNSGNKEQDYIIARDRALEDLVSQFLVSIVSTTNVESGEINGRSFDNIKEYLSTSVNQDYIEGVLIHPYSYSTKEGYLVYATIAKTAWDERRERDIRALETSVLQILHAAENAELLVEEFSLIKRALDVLDSSPYSAFAMGEAFGKYSYLWNLASQRMLSLYQAMHWSFVSLDDLSPFDDFSISVNVDIGNSPLKGQLKDKSVVGIPLVFSILSNREVLYEQTYTMLSEDKQVVTLQLPVQLRAPGNYELKVNLDLVAMGLDSSSLGSTYLFLKNYKTENMKLYVKPINNDFNNQFRRISTQIAKSLEASLVFAESEADSVLEIGFVVSKFPEIENSELRFVGTRILVLIYKDSNVVASIESEVIKGGGVGFDQAQATSFEKVLDFVDEKSLWIKELSQVIYAMMID